MKAFWTLVGLVVCGLLVGLSAYPWTVRGTARRAEIARAMGHDVGLDVTIGGPIAVKLLPRPRVQITDAQFRAPDGSIDLSTQALSGELDIAALLRGQWRLVSATLSSPTATIDADRAVGLASELNQGRPAPFKISIRSGVFRLVSRRFGTDTIVTDLAMTADTASPGNAGLSTTGSAVWRGVPGQFTVQIGAAEGEGASRQSSAHLHVNSPAGAFSAVGSMGGGTQPQFTGRVTASSPVPGVILNALGLGPFWIDLRGASLNGDVMARVGEVSLSEATLRLNATHFEGTLGYRSDNGRNLIEGTLATPRLDFGTIVGRSIDRAGLAQLYGASLASHISDMNLDLRLSAGEVVIGSAAAQDVALSVLCRDRRLEVTLDEAQAFGGIVKARLIGSLRPDDIETHAELALSDLDLGLLGVAITGQERMTGALSGKVAVDGHGQRLSDMVPTFAGDGRVSVENGSFMGMSVSQALKRFTRRLPMGADQAGQLTAFAAASSAIRIGDGKVNFVDGKVTGPGINLTFGGHSDLPGGRLDIVAVASPTDAAGAPIAGAPALPIEMRGGRGEPLILSEQNHHLPLPKFLLPDIDPGQILP